MVEEEARLIRTLMKSRIDEASPPFRRIFAAER